MKKKILLLGILLICLVGYSQTWTQQTSGTSNNLLGISAPSASICYISGSGGIILKTTNGGTTWVPLSSGISDDLYSAFFTDINNGYAVGNNGAAIKTTDGGTTWSPMFVSTSALRCVWFLNATTGYITGGDPFNGRIFKTTDAGASWSQVDNPSNSSYAIFFTSSTTGYATNYDGYVSKTTDGGASWTPKFVSSDALNGSMYFSSVNTGFFTGMNGTIYQTSDAGANWVLANSGTTDALTGIAFYDATHGYAVGGNVGSNTYRMVTTSNGGANWSNVTLNPGSARLFKINFFSPNVGYAVGLNGTIYKWAVPVSSTPDARFTSSEPGCHGQLENFYSVASGTPGLTHSWNFGANAIPSTSSQEDPSGIVYSTPGAKLVTHILSNGTAADTVTNIITINPSPTAVFTSNATACVKESINFTNTSSSGPGVSYTWDFGNGASPALSTAQSPQGITYTTSGSKNITLTVTNQFGCVTSSSQTISINALPTAFAGLDRAICTGTTVQLGSSPITGNTYSWQPSGTLNSSTLANPIASPGSPLNQYIVTVTALSSGCKNRDTVTIIVNPTPTASFNSNAPVCEGAAVNFTNTGSSGAGVTYAWDFGNNANPALSTAQNPSGVSYHSPGTKTITFAVTNQYGCVTSTTQAISIHALPVAFAGLDTTICANTSVQLGQPNVTGNTYTWFPSSTLSNKTISNPIASPVAPVTSYILTVVNTNNGCKNTDTVNVTMLAPLKAYAGVDGEICRYDHFQLGTGLVKGQVYSWNPVKGLNNATLPNPLASPDSTTTYTLTVTGSGCGTITDNVTITVHQLPVVNAGADDTINPGTTTHLNASGGIQYSWFPATGLSNPGIYNPLAYPDKTTLYTVTATDIYGCADSDTMLLTVLPSEFWIPTAFTPDGNGISDVFFIRGEGIQNFECTVFNRWGEPIFTSRNMLIGWDGKRQNGGEELPEGAYVYHVKGTLATGKQIASSGIINLIR